jgi:hypothetical protein
VPFVGLIVIVIGRSLFFPLATGQTALIGCVGVFIESVPLTTPRKYPH